MMAVLTGIHGISEALEIILHSPQDLYPPALEMPLMLWKLSAECSFELSGPDWCPSQGAKQIHLRVAP